MGPWIYAAFLIVMALGSYGTFVVEQGGLKVRSFCTHIFIWNKI